MQNLVLFALIAFIIFIVFILLKNFKIIKIGALCIVTGGVKCGKSTLSVYLTLSEYSKKLRSVKIKNFFRKLFRMKLHELPLIYSNVPLACAYVPITDDIIEDLICREKYRFAYKSVIYIQEASLFASSMEYRNEKINDALLHFNKLIGHETCGGCLIYDTQNIGDLHYSIKRSISNYIYIQNLNKKIPFFLIGAVRELLHNEDGDITNSVNKDLEEDLKKVLIPKSIWKKFDSYCYSALTDDLPVYSNVIDGTKLPDLKCRQVVSIKNILKRKGGSNEIK